jgi:hypothetical protein
MSLVGQYLRQAREARGIAIIQIEMDTRVRANIIEALEAGDFARLPPEPFLRGLVRTYANYLGADPLEAVRLLVADLAAPPPPKPRPVPPAPPPPRQPLRTLPRLDRKKTAPAPTTDDIHRPRSEPEPIRSAFAPTEWRSIPSPRLETPPPIPPPPETLERDALAPRFEPPSILRDIATRVRLPIPAIIGIGIAALIILGACGFLALSQLSSMVSVATRRTPTPTRVLATVTLPIPGGGAPTAVPTFAATAPPFATFPGNPTPPRRTPTRRPIDANSPLNLDIDTNEAIKVIIGIDGVQVFSGAMDPGTSRSWSAKDSLYMRVENAKGAEIFFNGKQILPAIFAERTVMERQWITTRGTPASARPTPPKTPTPIRTPTPTPTPTQEQPTEIPTPTPTLTPF